MATTQQAAMALHAPLWRITGTVGAGWQPLAAALSPRLTGAAAEAPASIVLPDAEPALEALLQSGVRLLGFVDAPETALVGMLAGVAADVSPAQLSKALAAWSDSARALLRLWQAWPGQVMLVATRELEADPATAAKVLRSQLGMAVDGLARVAAPTEVDALASLVAREAVAADGTAAALHDELLAACLPLSDQAGRSRLELATDALRERRQLQQASALARNRGDLLLEQTQQLRDELVRQVARASECDGTRAAQHKSATASGARPVATKVAPRLAFARWKVMQAHALAPHRHLHLSLTDVRADDETWPQWDLRLVEHHGRPGLALFADAIAPPPLRAWTPDGQENGRPFMLLIPSDPSRRAAIERLGSRDWSILLSLVRALRTALGASGATVTRPWPTVAERLLRQLEDLPPRLRYDGLAVSPTNGGTLELRLDEAGFGAARLGQIELRWTPQERRLLCLAPATDEPLPLAGWPVDPQGELQPSFELPVGAAAPSNGGVDFWREASPASRDLVLALVDVVSAAAAAQPNLPGVAAAAAALRADARRRVWRARLRRVVAGLRRRLHSA